MYQVKDAMSRGVVSLRPQATIEEAIALFLKQKMSGAPVLDEQGRMWGIVTQFQLMEVLYDPKFKHSHVEQCMTRKVLTIEEGALLGMAVNLFVMHRIHRLPVMAGDKVVGVISR